MRTKANNRSAYICELMPRIRQSLLKACQASAHVYSCRADREIYVCSWSAMQAHMSVPVRDSPAARATKASAPHMLQNYNTSNKEVETTSLQANSHTLHTDKHPPHTQHTDPNTSNQNNSNTTTQTPIHTHTHAIRIHIPKLFYMMPAG